MTSGEVGFDAMTAEEDKAFARQLELAAEFERRMQGTLPDGFEGTPLRKSFVLASRATRPWPGGKEPGEGHSAQSPSRRRVQAPGVPGPEWGARPGSAPTEEGE
mgnify:CR=1 FL=1